MEAYSACQGFQQNLPEYVYKYSVLDETRGERRAYLHLLQQPVWSYGPYMKAHAPVGL
jgi:hypothetical protein